MLNTISLVLLLNVGMMLAISQFISAQDFFPAEYPLAVRSPYLHAWIRTPNGTSPSNILGWSGYVLVDGVPWQWLGQDGPGNTTEVMTSEITPTQTRFIVRAGLVELNITFFSPIEPSDLAKQSFPFMYLSVETTILDGKQHAVHLYSDITAEWISSDRSKVAVWNTNILDTEDVVYHQATLQSPVPMKETVTMAEDSTVYYAMQRGPQMTYQSGDSAKMRDQFASIGVLNNTQDSDFRAIDDDGNFVAFAFTADLGNNTSFATPIVWALGVVRDPVILYNLQSRRSYFWTQFSTISNAISAFLSDYNQAVQRAIALDWNITNDAQRITANLTNLVALGARQALTSDITISQDSNGDWNYSDILAFQRDTGQTAGVNAVDTLYSTMPIHLYLNASLLGLHLQPLLQYQDSSNYTNEFAAPDLGLTYPIASGASSSNTTPYSLESTGNMLIMAWAHARVSGDGTLIQRHYDLLKKWTGFLTTNSLHPNNQISTDGLEFANNSNLAIKGILAIASMAQISSAMGEEMDAQVFQANASALYQTWKSLALSSTSPGHLLSPYGNTNSSAYTLMYNMYPDKLLGLGLIDQSIYDAQAAYYSTLAQTASQFGISFDTSSNGLANSAWTLFTAGSINDNTNVRDALIDMVYAHANSNSSDSIGPFPTSYSVDTGHEEGGEASPGQGAMFALLALNLSTPTIRFPSLSTPSAPSPSSSSSVKHPKTPMIIGATVGGLAILLAGLGLLVFCLKRARSNNAAHSSSSTVQPFIWPILTSTVRSHRKYYAKETSSSSSANVVVESQSLEVLRREVARLRQELGSPEHEPPPPQYEQFEQF